MRAFNSTNGGSWITSRWSTVWLSECSANLSARRRLTFSRRYLTRSKWDENIFPAWPWQSILTPDASARQVFRANEGGNSSHRHKHGAVNNWAKPKKVDFCRADIFLGRYYSRSVTWLAAGEKRKALRKKTEQKITQLPSLCHEFKHRIKCTINKRKVKWGASLSAEVNIGHESASNRSRLSSDLSLIRAHIPATVDVKPVSKLITRR